MSDGEEEGENEVSDELEALCAIFDTDFTNTSADGQHQCTILCEGTALNFDLPPDYPAVAADVTACDTSCAYICDITVQSRLDALQATLYEKMKTLVGAPLMYETTLAAQEWLEQHPLAEWKPPQALEPAVDTPCNISPRGKQHSGKAKVCVLEDSRDLEQRRAQKAVALQLGGDGGEEGMRSTRIPSLQSLCLTCMLHRAEQYDDQSRDIIAESLQFFCELSSGLTLLSTAIQASELVSTASDSSADQALVSVGLLTFAGLGRYPALCDWTRQQLATRPKLGRKIFQAVYEQCQAIEKKRSKPVMMGDKVVGMMPVAQQPGSREAEHRMCASVEAVLDWMVGLGRFKRDMQPPLLTKEQGDTARKTKKLLRSIGRSKQGDQRPPSEWAAASSQQRQRQFGIYVPARRSQSWRSELR
jgi:hypothetical protein